MASGLRQRIITAIIIGIPILALVFYSGTSQLLFLALLGLLMSWEYTQLMKTGLSGYVRKAAALGSAALLIGLAYYCKSEFTSYLLPISLLANLYLLFELFARREAIQFRLPLLWNLLYVVLPIALLVSVHKENYFSLILISILLMVWISDIGGYFVGKSTGKRKLFPSVSPGKTWEGFWGAGLLSLLFSYAFYSYFANFSVRTWALIALTVWLFGSWGDLVESKLKRQAGVKDSGTIMPGHGGFLDRFDAFIFCIPFVLFLIHYFN